MQTCKLSPGFTLKPYQMRIYSILFWLCFRALWSSASGLRRRYLPLLLFAFASLLTFVFFSTPASAVETDDVFGNYIHSGELSLETGAISIQVSLEPEELAYLEQLGPLTVAPDPDWRPFSYLDEHGRFAGIAIDLLTLLEERLGISFTYVQTRDWDDAVERSKAGEVLILPSLIRRPRARSG